MKKFKHIFLATLIFNILGIIPLFLILFVPEMRQEMVYAQFPGMESNELAKELFNTFMTVFAAIGIAMIIAIAYAIKLKTKESAIAASIILLFWNIGWVIPDWFNLLSGGGGHPPLIVMCIGLIPIILLPYGIKNAEI